MKSLIQLFSFLGLPPVAATALAVLVMEARALSLSELSQKTGYAKSHLSTHLKHLAVNGYVEAVKTKRRILYRVDKNGVLRHLLIYFSNLNYTIENALNTINDKDLNSFLRTLSTQLNDIIKRYKGEVY